METIDFNEVIRDPETISVVGGLIGNVTAAKDGLMNAGDYRGRMQYLSLSLDIVMKVANFKDANAYSGFLFSGFSTVNGEIILFSIYTDSTKIPKMNGNNPSIYGIRVYYDNDFNIYFKCKTGTSVKGFINGKENYVLEVTKTTLPSDVTEIFVSN